MRLFLGISWMLAEYQLDISWVSFLGGFYVLKTGVFGFLVPYFFSS